LAAAFGLAAAFFVPAALGFFAVVAFLTFGLAAFFVAVFLAPAGLAVLALACFGFFVLVPVADFVLAILTFFGLAAVVADVVAAWAGAAPVAVAAEFVLAGVAAFLAGFVPADFERERFFVPDAALPVDLAFFGFADFFLAGFFVAPSANLNDPLAPLPFVCLKCLALTPF